MDRSRCQLCGQYLPGLTRRPRTTGPRSQCNRLNGFVQQVAMDTGDDFDSVKAHVKHLAISRGYPFVTTKWGEVVPKSEAKATVEESALLIETVEQVAAELGIALREE